MADPLSDVLHSVRLSGGVFLEARFTAPWCVVANLEPSDCTHSGSRRCRSSPFTWW